MEHVIHNIRVAIRTLLKQKSFTLVALLTLALGTGATTAVFSVVDGVLLKPLPYADPDRIVSLWGTARDNPGPNIVGTVSHLNFLDWKREAKSFESIALYGATNFIVNGLGDADLVRGATVSPDFFRVFKATPTIGREFSEEEDLPNGPKVAIVSYSFWRDRLGGRSDVLGSTIRLSAGPAEIVGVAPPGFDFPAHANLWTPVQNDDQACGRGCVYVDGIARLKPGVSVEQARSEMQGIAAQLESAYPATNSNTTVGVLRLQDETVRDARTALLFILASVVMVLLIACANVANLVMIRGAARQNELVVRAALGGSRKHLLSHLLTEQLLLAFASGTVGSLLAWWGIGVLKRIGPRDLPRLSEVAFDGTTFLFAVTVTLLSMLVFGLAPSLRLIRTSALAHALNQRGTVSGAAPKWTRSVLVAGEVALSLMLVVGTGLLVRTLDGMQSVDLGFKPQNLSIFTLNLPALRYPTPADVFRTFDQLEDEFKALPGVEQVARINGLPLSGSENVQNFTRPDRPAPAPGKVPSVLYRVVDTAYFRTMGIPLFAGHDFTLQDRLNGGAIISRKMAEQFWPGEDPIGKSLQIGGGPLLNIVGVVANVRSQELTREAQAELYLMQAPARTMTFVLRIAFPSADLIGAVRNIVRRTDSNLPLIRPNTMMALVDQQMARTRFSLLLAGLFAVLAVVLAGVGTYGVVAYALVQRTREIGLRLALGASPTRLLVQVMWEGFRPAAIGLFVGLSGAYAASRAITSMLFQVRANDPATFIVVTALLSLLAVVATVIPAVRATQISPASTLKGE
jgi:putative ABC transport system permease protein